MWLPPNVSNTGRAWRSPSTLNGETITQYYTIHTLTSLILAEMLLQILQEIQRNAHQRKILSQYPPWHHQRYLILLAVIPDLK